MLAVPRVSVAFRIAGVLCHSDSIPPVPLRSFRFFGFPRKFCEVLRIENHCMDSVAIKALSIDSVLTFSFFLLYATSCILDRLSRIQSFLLVLELLVCELSYQETLLALAQHRAP